MTTERADVLVKGGLLVSGEKITRPDVLTSDGKVKEVGPDLSGRQANRTLDAAGQYVLPGGIASHAHPVLGDRENRTHPTASSADRAAQRAVASTRETSRCG